MTCHRGFMDCTERTPVAQDVSGGICAHVWEQGLYRQKRSMRSSLFCSELKTAKKKKKKVYLKEIVFKK